MLPLTFIIHYNIKRKKYWWFYGVQIKLQ